MLPWYYFGRIAYPVTRTTTSHLNFATGPVALRGAVVVRACKFAADDVEFASQLRDLRTPARIHVGGAVLPICSTLTRWLRSRFES